jgi:protein-disulfide isomerase
MKPLSAGDIVAAVGARNITLADVDDIALQQPVATYGSLKLGQALYEARRAALDNLVTDILLTEEAKARGIDRGTLVDREITAKVTQPTDSEIALWYQSNRDRVSGAPLEQARSPIRAYLVQERTRAARDVFVDQLKGKTPVRIMLEPPRQAVKAADGPAKGPASAPIEIIEFSDFQCPYCLRAHSVVQRVLDTYGDRIRLVYRHYPLGNHPNAWPAAEASQCAAEQGRFWPYHDRLFANPTKLHEPELKQTAVDLGLDAGRFNDCLDSHKYKNVVEADVRAGDEAGVQGTPCFFINGRALSGAQPFEAFKRIIDDELELKRMTVPAR